MEIAIDKIRCFLNNIIHILSFCFHFLGVQHNAAVKKPASMAALYEICKEIISCMGIYVEIFEFL